MTILCGDEALRDLVEIAAIDDTAALERASRLIRDFPDDPRLSFLQASILVSAGRLIEGYRAMERAVSAAPDYAIARFQLGFLQLTSGEAQKAVATWGPLASLPPENYLRRFKDGLESLIRDEFEAAIRDLEHGITLNAENVPLNRDMQLIIDECEKLIARAATRTSRDGDTATSLLLRQQTIRPTRH